MPSWPEQTKYISKSTLRIDAPEKVTGRAHYSSDIDWGGVRNEIQMDDDLVTVVAIVERDRCRC